MFPLNWREEMNRVNTDVKLDPDFGTIVPPVEYYYWVSVTPKKEMPYRFILMVPIIEEDEDLENLIMIAVDQLVGDAPKSVVEPFDIDSFDKVSKSTYIASFDPNCPDVFCWLLPPNHLKN